MSNSIPSRDELADRYLEQLSYKPYPIQEESLLAWFGAEQGVLVCAPTGTGKTLIAEAALFEALHLGKRAYYTTPLIALTEQKFREMQTAAANWGFHPDDVGLVTGNRRVNPDAKILVVVAEILFNRLLHQDQFTFDDVWAVVMDEFHSFNDPERGVVWEFSLELLPSHVRTLLLSATVGNAVAFCNWLRRTTKRELEPVLGNERKVPLVFEWVGDRLLNEHLEMIAKGGEGVRMTPALVFCFNRDECWDIAEQVKGKKVVDEKQQAKLAEELQQYDFSQGAGPKLRQLLQRGVGVHHAGVLPKYRRIVEDLFQRKLLSIATCTETLSAGINLPARSVILPSIMKGPPGKRRIIDPSTAHQIFGRAGRPQYDDCGFVYVLAHEDDVRISRWKVEYDRIPEDTKDPGLMKAKKRLKKKMPKRNTEEQYWNEQQFEKLKAAPPADLAGCGPIPWRLLTYLLDASPEVDPIRKLVGRRLMTPKQIETGQKQLDAMLLTLHRAGYVKLEPEPPAPGEKEPSSDKESSEQKSLTDKKLSPDKKSADQKDQAKPSVIPQGLFTKLMGQPKATKFDPLTHQKIEEKKPADADADKSRDEYHADRAVPTELLDRLLLFRGVHPLYGLFLINQLGIADRAERLQAMESILELPGTVARFVRVPRQKELPPGTLATGRLDEQLLQLGLATAEELLEPTENDDEPWRGRRTYDEEPVRVLTFADKLRRLFDYEYPGVRDLRTTPVWAAGEVLEFDDFNKYVTSKQLQKQEGMIFRHLLRLILLIAEFKPLTPPDTTPDAWQSDLTDIETHLVNICRTVDPTSTEHTLQQIETEAE